MPDSYGRPLWRSLLWRWPSSQAIRIVTKTNETPAKAKPRTYQSALVTLQETPSIAVGRRGGCLDGRPQVEARAVDRAHLILRAREALASSLGETSGAPGLASSRGITPLALGQAGSPSRHRDGGARRGLDRHHHARDDSRRRLVERPGRIGRLPARRRAHGGPLRDVARGGDVRRFGARLRLPFHP